MLPALFIPWVLHGTFDFLLTIGQNMSSSYGLILFFAALFVFIGGLVYARYESTEMAKDFPESVNIFQKINEAEVCTIFYFGVMYVAANSWPKRHFSDES